MTKLPFFTGIEATQLGCASIEEALPQGSGVVHGGGWVQQPLILAHPSLGCFVTHCGFSLIAASQLVIVPQIGDQILNTRVIAEEFKAGVEVDKPKNLKKLLVKLST